MNRDPNAVDSRRRGERHVDQRLMKAPGIIYVDYDVAAIADELHTIAGTWPKIVDVDDATFWPIVHRRKLPPLDEADVQDKIDRFINSPGTFEEKVQYVEKRYSRRVRYRIVGALGDHMSDIIRKRRKALEARATEPRSVLARNLGITERR